MRIKFPISSHTRNIYVIENQYTYIFHIPLFRSEMDSYPIIPNIKIKDDTCYITFLKPLKSIIKDNKENKLH